ncbi:hypothetical protein [Embleya sp. AB8]|uniref:hypothetical protein n=1 Tax=Embleya sp. AB8 TaxID=3156304 RepID=UPI003C715D40
MLNDHRERPTADGPDVEWVQAPPEEEIRRVYEPVEIRNRDGSWTLGRINARWHGRHGEDWCRLRIVGSHRPAQWVPFDPEVFVELQIDGT